MRASKPAISIRPAPRGWTWTLIDASGATADSGLADRQEGALAAAWLAARSRPEFVASEFPDVTIIRPVTATGAPAAVPSGDPEIRSNPAPLAQEFQCP